MTDFQKRYLESIVRQTSVAKNVGLRAEMLVRFAEGEAKRSIARRVGVNVLTVRKWVQRWENCTSELGDVENAMANADDPAQARRDYERKILETLKDAPRSGTPPTFSAEQITMLVALSCEVLDESDEATSYRTQEELAQEAQGRGIVESISQSSVSRILKNRDSEAA